MRQAGQALAPVLLVERLASLSDPVPRPSLSPQYCAGLLMATLGALADGYELPPRLPQVLAPEQPGCTSAESKRLHSWMWRRSRSWTLLLGDFRQLPAVLDSWAGRPISAPLEHSELIRDLAGGHRHELTENMRFDPGIFNFVKWLRVGEEACPTLEQAKARLRELFPSKPGWPDTTLVISHSKRMAVNAAANRALAPKASKLLELEVIHMVLRSGNTWVYCNTKQPAA